MRVPATFVVVRHLLGAPAANPSELARATGLHRGTISKVLRRLPEGLLAEPWRAASWLAALPERPSWHTLQFDIPNPRRFRQALAEEMPGWVTGETTAPADGIHIFATRASLFVRPDDLGRLAPLVRAHLGVLAPAKDATVTIRAADPWLDLNETDPRAPLGQRLYDYVTDARIAPILWSRPLAPLLS